MSMKHDRLARAHERRVELRHHAARVRRLRAEHDAVRLHEVVDRASPSFRNSGLLHTWKGNFASFAISAATLAALPTGTVDFVTTTISRVMWRPTRRATCST